MSQKLQTSLSENVGIAVLDSLGGWQRTKEDINMNSLYSKDNCPKDCIRENFSSTYGLTDAGEPVVRTDIDSRMVNNYSCVCKK